MATKDNDLLAKLGELATLELFCSMSTFIVGGNLDVTIFHEGFQ